MAGAMMMFGTVWLAHVVVGGAPGLFAWVAKLPGRWRLVSAALVVLPIWALVLMQGIWPVGGASSFLVRLGLLTIVVFVAELLLVLPASRNGAAWIRMLLLAAAICSVVPIQLVVPSLPD